MSETGSVKAIGISITALGIIVLLIGFAMPATTTQTSETCVDDPMGYGQNCVSGAVETPNPLKGPVTVLGFFALVGGIGVTLMNGNNDQHKQRARQSRNSIDGSFEKELQKHQKKQSEKEKQE